MNHLFDEFSKSLGESLPRRESLRRLGALFAGAILSPLGMETAWARGPDPCKAFCKCRNAKQQNQCLAACKACNGNTSRLGGSCGSYVCCSVAACKGVCNNLTSDPNCGACGNNCSAFGETCCGTYCADLDNDINNCGGCGFVCSDPGQFCSNGTCDCWGQICDGVCTDVLNDSLNCGGCFQACPAGSICSGGSCCDPTVSDCFGSW
jgi:hypothetical protein